MAIWLLLIPAIVSLWILQYYLRQKFRQQAGFESSICLLSKFTSLGRDVVILIAAVFAAVTLVLAVMRPQLYLEVLLPEYEKQDLVLFLDRSVSMYATDVLPSRFDRAIDEIKGFLIEKPAEIDRVALIGFANTSITLSHLTRDLDTLFFFLDWMREDPQIYYGTNITNALSAGREMVQKDNQPTRKIFLILSDGEDQSTELPKLLTELRQEDITVHSIGIGSENAVPIPLARSRGSSLYLEDDQGEQISTLLDETTMRLIASTTTGSFFRSVTGRELADTIRQIMIEDRLQTGWHHLQDYKDIHLPLLLLSCIFSFFLILRI